MDDYRDIRQFIQSEIKCEEYNTYHQNKLEEFYGIFRHSMRISQFQRDVVENITAANTIWTSSKLLSPGFILGVVIYTGDQTRFNMIRHRQKFQGSSELYSIMSSMRTTKL